MASNTRCLDADLLQRLQRGQVSIDEVDSLGEHLLECPTCAEAAGSFSADDTLTAVARAGTLPVDDADRSQIDDLIDQLHRLTLAKSVPYLETEAELDSNYDFLAPAQQPDEMGRFGQYRVLEVIGAGGMGIVFRAEEVLLRRQVALKVLRPMLARNPSARRRFLREAQTTAALEHEHVVSIYQVGEESGVPFLAMALLQGETLEARLQRDAPLPLSELLRIGREIAEGLAAAHERGLIHRDVKPANVFLSLVRGASSVTLLDFGLARLVTGDVHLTQEGLVAGTPLYMAPEQAAGEQCDGRCDLFSLGCVLYRMATGRLPFAGDSTLSILHALAVRRPTPPRDHRPDLPPAVNELILRLLAPSPEDRPATARAVVEELAELERAPSWRGPRSRRRWLWHLTAGMLVVAALGLFFGPWLYHRVIDSGRPGINGSDFDREGAGLIRFFRGHRGTVTGVAFLNEGHVLSGGADGTLRVWDVESGEEKRHFEVPMSKIMDVAVSQDRRFVLAAGSDDTVRLIDAIDGRELQRTVQPRTTDVAFSPGGERALFSSYPGTVALWDVPGWKQLRLFDPVSKRAGICFSADGHRAFSAGFNTIVSGWDLEDGREVRTLQAHPKGNYVVTCTPDGRYVLTGGFDGDLRLWNATNGKEVRRFAGHTDAVRSVATDGRHVLSGGEDKTVRLWDIETGKALHVFEGHVGYVMRVALSRDGRFAVSGGPDGGVGFWRLPKR